MYKRRTVPKAPHGTHMGYVAGCRCTLCEEAENAARRIRNKAKENPADSGITAKMKTRYVEENPHVPYDW